MSQAEYRSIYRTHTCGGLNESHVGSNANLSGWVMRKRDHGGVLFIDLRDNYGVTQLVFSGENAPSADHLKLESVIKVEGVVMKRDPELVNPKISTGHIELKVGKLEILSAAEPLPFQVAEDDKTPEPLRLRYRFLELRRETLHRNIALRAGVIRAMRDEMHARGFTEFQTPILTSSSPEGARDFLVPSRLHPGNFYALPQSPQQFKQLLMVAGFDRYFQIAPCFRDEDARADRSPGEFYQLDFEMSFVEENDVLKVGEEVLSGVFKRFTDLPVTSLPFPRIKFQDALDQYGTDKPDMRNPLLIEDVTELFRSTPFRVFAQAVGRGERIKALRVPVSEIPSRKYLDDFVEEYTKLVGGLAYLIFEEQDTRGSIIKLVGNTEVQGLKELCGAGKHVVFLMAGKPQNIMPHFAKLRVRVGNDLGLSKNDQFCFCYVTDMPMYERDSETGKIDFAHNPFSMPHGGLEALKTKDPLTILAHQYDIVCNGYELSSGAIRNHSPEILYAAFGVCGYGPEEVEKRFGGMLRAFQFGAPPHGGMAPGVDRIVMLLGHQEAIRDVIAFPMTQHAEDLLMGAPSEVFPHQLRDVHIQVKLAAPTRKV
jgi:aspartyl-tRNA synthetase